MKTRHLIISLIFLAIYHQECRAQQMDLDHFNIVVNEPTFTRYLRIVDKEKTLLVSPRRDYEWYKSNRVLTTKGGQGGRLLHGNYKEHHLNKNLKTKGHYYMGLKRGKWQEWHPNGMIKSKSRFFFGLKNGREFQYDEVGNLLYISKYRRGHRKGKTKFYLNGKVVKYEFYKRGELIRSTQKQRDVNEGLNEKEVKPETKDNLSNKEVRKERKRLLDIIRNKKPNDLKPKNDKEGQSVTD